MLEKMDEFFTARIKEYEEHMIKYVPGCKYGYTKLAELLPSDTSSLLDLGCGTGLELDEIFKKNHSVKVTGIDLTKPMLDILKSKYPDKDMVLINDSYIDYDFGTEAFDAAISFQTMHHFSHENKIRLYSKVFSALKKGGKYIECDYMVIEQQDEDLHFAESQKLRLKENIMDNELYHFDTPCTIDNQLKMLGIAGFESASMIWREENTTIIVADKSISH